MLFRNKGEHVKDNEQPKYQDKKKPTDKQPKPQNKKPSSEPHEEKPRITTKVNEALGSKGKEKLIDDEEEEELLSGGEKLVRKNRDKVLDDLLILRKELEAKEA